MSNFNDTTIDQLANTICACIRHEVPDNAVHEHVDRIVKTAEAKAATFLHETTAESEDETGPEKTPYDDIRAAAWILNRMLDKFPVRPLYDAGFTVDAETNEELRRASAALRSASNLIEKAARRKGYRSGDVQ